VLGYCRNHFHPFPCRHTTSAGKNRHPATSHDRNAHPPRKKRSPLQVPPAIRQPCKRPALHFLLPTGKTHARSIPQPQSWRKSPVV
jgi:hypothetical protein